jgi:hypothetical protein
MSAQLDMAKLALQQEGHELELLAAVEGEDEDAGDGEATAAAPAISAEPTMMSQEARNLFLNGDKDQGLEAWKVRLPAAGCFNPCARREFERFQCIAHCCTQAWPVCAQTLQHHPCPDASTLARMPPRSRATTARSCRCLGRRGATRWWRPTYRWGEPWGLYVVDHTQLATPPSFSIL